MFSLLIGDDWPQSREPPAPMEVITMRQVELPLCEHRYKSLHTLSDNSEFGAKALAAHYPRA